MYWSKMVLNILEASGISYTEVNRMDVHEFFINYTTLVERQKEKRLNARK